MDKLIYQKCQENLLYNRNQVTQPQGRSNIPMHDLFASSCNYVTFGCDYLEAQGIDVVSILFYEQAIFCSLSQNYLQIIKTSKIGNEGTQVISTLESFDL